MDAITLPVGLLLRAPRADEAQAIADLVNTCGLATDGDTSMTTADIYRGWSESDFHLEEDAWLVTTSQGQIVGYEEVQYDNAAHHADIDGYVHPNYCGQGIGTFLLAQAEQRVRLLAQRAKATSISLHAGVSIRDVTALALFEAMGYHIERHFWHMAIEMREQPAAPQWPTGIRVRSFVPGQDDRIVHAAREEAFEDHWNHHPFPFEEWQRTRVHVEGFDPSLWLLALDGEEVAAVILCRHRPDGGWVGSLGVRRQWRQRGLGMALLLHAFGEFYRRGTQTVALSVDAQNPTGATRLYERAGMHVIRHYLVYAKEIHMP